MMANSAAKRSLTSHSVPIKALTMTSETNLSAQPPNPVRVKERRAGWQALIKTIRRLARKTGGGPPFWTGGGKNPTFHGEGGRIGIFGAKDPNAAKRTKLN